MKSELCIFDLSNRAVTTVWRTDMLIEAPNWSRDGGFLVFNGEGLIWRLDLTAGGEPLRIDTGFAVKCNNDHGISPDGETLVISDGTEFGSSCIYTLPLAGGEPKRITRNVPSYWHGWSPDGKTLVSSSAEFVYIWDVDRGVLKRKLRHPHDKGCSVAVSPDGKVIATSDLQYAGDPGVDTIRLYDIDTGELLMTAEPEHNRAGVLSFSPDGRKLLTGYGRGSADIWDISGLR